MWNILKQNDEEAGFEAGPSPDGRTTEAPAMRQGVSATDKPRQTAVIGRSIQIKGELVGNEDLTIEGSIEGKIDLKQHHLTIGSGGRISADIQARQITIKGEVRGNVKAQELVEIKAGGKLRGDIVTPRVAISDGAFFKGSVEMEETPENAGRKTPDKGADRTVQALPMTKSAHG